MSKATFLYLVLFISIFCSLMMIACATPQEPGDKDWRDTGLLNRESGSCIAPTAAEYFDERAKEFLPPPPAGFLSTDLESTLNKLPFGQCGGAVEQSHVLKLCDNSISLSVGGGVSAEEKVFSLQNGSLLFAQVSTDSNMFCHSESFDLAYGTPPDNCESYEVNYCNIERVEIMNLFQSNQLDKIGSAILAGQD